MSAFFFILPVLVLVAGALARGGAAVGLQGTKNKFAALGTIAGRSKDEIVAAVGPPTSVSQLAGGKSLLQWQHISQAGGYHIALRFGPDGVCEGVTHEHSGRRRR